MGHEDQRKPKSAKDLIFVLSTDLRDEEGWIRWEESTSRTNYPPPPPPQVATGYPMTAVAPPPNVYNNASVQPNPQVYPVVPNATVSQGRDDLSCCGLGLGWLLFILGFLLGVIPWYIGFILLLCNKEPREKAGYVACTIASAVGTVIIVVIIVVSVVISSRG